MSCYCLAHCNKNDKLVFYQMLKWILNIYLDFQVLFAYVTII